MNLPQQWEYKSVGSENFEAPEIKQLGMEGWELVAILKINYQHTPLSPITDLPVFMFKRPFIKKLEAVE